jgi:hypothetical protein
MGLEIKSTGGGQETSRPRFGAKLTEKTNKIKSITEDGLSEENKAKLKFIKDTLQSIDLLDDNQRKLFVGSFDDSMEFYEDLDNLITSDPSQLASNIKIVFGSLSEGYKNYSDETFESPNITTDSNGNVTITANSGTVSSIIAAGGNIVINDGSVTKD